MRIVKCELLTAKCELINAKWELRNTKYKMRNVKWDFIYPNNCYIVIVIIMWLIMGNAKYKMLNVDCQMQNVELKMRITESR